MGKMTETIDPPLPPRASTRRRTKPKLIKADRPLAWVLLIFAFLTILTGYARTRRLFDRHLMLTLHGVFEWVFLVLFFLHTVIANWMVPFGWRLAIVKIKERKAKPALVLRLLQRLSGVLIAIFTILVVVTALDWYWDLPPPFTLDEHVRVDLGLTIAIILHGTISAKIALTRHGYRQKWINYFLVVCAVLACVAILDLEFLPFTPNSGTGNRRGRGGSG